LRVHFTWADPADTPPIGSPVRRTPDHDTQRQAIMYDRGRRCRLSALSSVSSAQPTANLRREPAAIPETTDVTINRINPESLHDTPGYHHVTVVDAGRLAFLAGQCPLLPDGTLAGPDLATQVDQVVANTLAVLAAVKAGPEHVVRTVIYVVSDDNVVLAEVWRGLTASRLGPAFSTASTLLGVVQLGFTGQLVELDVTAALPD
jgi:enamine deaminase RidA (YjgF/YER057c/UK114 family)